MEDAEIDPYKILELNWTVEDVTDSDVLKAYRKLSLKYHPDRNKSENATQMFQRLTAARDMLLDTEARAAFVQVRRAKRARQEQEEQMDEQARARSKQRRAMAEELERRERTAAKSLSDLQRAQANLAAQMRRMREMAIAKKRAELRTQAATAATAAAAAAAEAAAAGQPARDGDADAPAVDAETLTLLKSSLQARWSTEHAKHDATSMRELFSRFGEVVHVSMRKASARAGPNRSAVVVMGNSTAATKACNKAAATCGHPMLVTPLPKVADVDGLAVAAPGAAQAAAAKLRRADISAAAAAAPRAATAAAPPPAQRADGGGGGGGTAPSSFPGVRVGPPRPPRSFPSSFPEAGAGNRVAGASAPAADGTGGAEARPQVDAGKQLGAGCSLGSDVEGVTLPSDSEYREQSKVGEGMAQSAAAKQLERDALRARLLAEAEAEDALNQSD
eukprot:jgi/Ulvmu1/10967/UM007_0146.1